MQTLYIIGNVGREAEIRHTPSGQTVCNFSVAVNEKYTNSAGEKVERTTWFRIQTWGKSAEIHNQYVKKGMLIFVEGQLVADPSTGGPKVYDTKNGSSASFEINASRVKYLSHGNEKKPENETSTDNPEEMPF